MSEPAIVVTGLGVVSALGHDLSTFFRALLEQRCGARDVPRWHGLGLRYTHAAMVEREPILARLAPEERDLPWASAMGVVAARAALVDAGRAPELGGAPLCVACSIGAPGAIERQDVPWERIDTTDPETLSRYSQGALIAHLAGAIGARGPVTVLVTTCAGGNYAIGAALDALRHGEAELVLAGGIEEVSTTVYTSFHQIRALAEVCRPFDAARAGLLFGEGAGFLVLERAGTAQARGARVYGQVLSVGYSNDAHHLVAPHPQGEGAARAIRRALAEGGVAAREVGYVNAHGTGTPLNDAGEALALRAALGDDAARVPVSSTKGATGHAMGAASALEAVATLLALHEGQLPPTTGLSTPDPALALDVIAGAPRPLQADVALSNAFGFGGNNAVLAASRVVRAVPPQPRRDVFVSGMAALAGPHLGVRKVYERFLEGEALRQVERHATFDPAAILGKKGLRHIDRGTVLWGAALEVDLPSWPAVAKDRAGAVFGAAYPAYTGVMNIMREFLHEGATQVNPVHVPFATANCAPSWWLLRRGITGFNGSLGSGECAGLDAIIYGARQIELGRADALVTGGAEGHQDELWRTIERGRWSALPLAEGAGALALSAYPDDAWARVVASASAFMRGDSQAALERAIEALLQRARMPLVDLLVAPRPAALEQYANTVWITGTVLGEALGASSALAAVIGACALLPGLREAAHVMVVSDSREGYASALLLEAARIPGVVGEGGALLH